MEQKKWWLDGVGYIIYPQSFLDSDGDGFGDLNGLRSKLDYLHDLGVNILWICPLFDSPMDDGGYDVRDYYKINPLYGSDEDFSRLIEEAHARGIRLLLDLTLNHTSIEHPWFKKALAEPSSEERGYYFIRKGRRVDGKLLPPNNWESFFFTSAWENIEGTDDFYLHLFSPKMPDVDWSNPKLRERYHAIARYYLDRGIDGFRLDAIAHIAKAPGLPDSPKPIDATGYVLDVDMYSNRDEVLDYLKEFDERVFSAYDCLVVGEAGGCISPERALKLVNRKSGPINMVFNFDCVWQNGGWESIGKKKEERQLDLVNLKRNFLRWYQVCHAEADMPLYWCNHDHPRVLSQYGSKQFRNESAKCLLITLLFLYGTPFIYQGEEIGMANPDYPSIEDYYADPGERSEVPGFRKRGYSEEEILDYLQRTSRLSGRSPIPWNRGENGGFTTGTPWLKLGEEYKHGINVLDEMNDPWSIINFYQYAILKRRLPDLNETVLNGELQFIDIDNPDVFAYLHDGTEKLMVVSNFRPYEVKFDFYWRIKDVVLHNYDSVLLDNHTFTLRPFESFLLKV